MLGWECVVKKGEFQVGDLCVYFEIDSLLPPVKEFDFLSKNGIRGVTIDGVEYKGYKLKTIRLKGQVSQGLALPMAMFPSISSMKEDDDVTEILGVVKWEPPVTAMQRGARVSTFPDFIPKTDETRIQTCFGIVSQYFDQPWYMALKYDGMSATYAKKDGEFFVCSRNQRILRPEEGSTPDPYWEMAIKYNIEKLLPENTAIQGEVYGQKIQGNPHKENGIDFVAFNVFDIEKQDYYGHQEFQSFFAVIPIPRVQHIAAPKYDTVREYVEFVR